MSLCIHPDYNERLEPTHFDDRELRDEWQDAVYAYARGEALARGVADVLDYGCGSGYKLMKYFSAVHTIGYELEPSLSYLREQYPDRDWRHVDADQRFVGGLMICADVIEHMVDPLPFLEKLKQGPLQTFIFSTPALELLSERGWSSRLGPPTNTSHVREWTTREFRDLMEMHFKVLDQVVINCVQGTQLILAELRSEPWVHSEMIDGEE